MLEVMRSASVIVNVDQFDTFVDQFKERVSRMVKEDVVLCVFITVSVVLKLTGVLTYIIYHVWRIVVSSLFCSTTAAPKEDGDRYTFDTNGIYGLVTALVGESASRPWSGASLQFILKRFSKKKLGVSGKERDRDLQLSRQVATLLWKGLKEKAPQFNYPEEPELVGSASDATMIARVGDCDYLLHVDIPASIFTRILLGGDIDLDPQGEGYWRLRLKNPSEAMKKLTVLVEESDTDFYCLSPLKVHAFLMGQVQRIVDSYSPTDINGVMQMKQTSTQAGPAIKLKINKDYPNYKFDMDFVPCITIGGRQLVSKRHPSVGKLHRLTTTRRSDPDTLGWRQSFSTAERDRISPLVPNAGWQCTKKVYRIVKYLRYNDSQFAQFNSYIYKTVFLYLLDEHSKSSDWREEDLADRFLDYMRKLEVFFKSGHMYHYYLQKNEKISRNLLDHDGSKIMGFYDFLHRKNIDPDKKWGSLIENM